MTTASTPQPLSVPPAPATPRGAANLFRTAMLPIVLLLIVAYFTASDPIFLSPQNLSNLAIELSIAAVLALGMLLVILPGHIDLSAGSGVGLIGGVAAILVFNHNWAALPALAVATLVAIAIWWVMGAIIITQRVPSFIITLGGLLIFRGVEWKIINSHTIPITHGGVDNLFSALTTYRLPPMLGLVLAALVIAGLAVATWAGYSRLKAAKAPVDGELAFLRAFVIGQLILLFVFVCNNYRGVPLPAVILGVVALAVHVLIRHTPYGRYLYAIGGNEEAAVVSGLPVSKVTIAAFAIMGLLVAITGFLQTAYTGSSTTTTGELMELDAVAACVIGGVSLKGGRGTVGGVILGSLIMAVLLNGMTLLSYSPEAKYIIRGTVLAAAVWADTRLGRR